MSKPPVLSDSKIVPDVVYKPSNRRLVSFGIFVMLLVLLLCRPLFSLAVYALNSDLHSYIVLVPFISAYLLYILRDRLPKEYSSSLDWAAFPFLVGAGLLISAQTKNSFEPSAIAFAFVCFAIAGGFAFLGRKWMSAAIFPFAFLLFMIPLPDAVADWMEQASKFASAECAAFFLQLTGTPVLQDGTIFQLPNMVIEVAKECSGIRSSWVLLIASTVAAYLFLSKGSHRVLLTLAAIPLGVLRNGFRIALIALLCINFGPQMIHSPIHRQGGPLFFALSLIPLFFMLWLLRRNEKARATKAEGRNGGEPANESSCV